MGRLNGPMVVFSCHSSVSKFTATNVRPRLRSIKDIGFHPGELLTVYKAPNVLQMLRRTLVTGPAQVSGQPPSLALILLIFSNCGRKVSKLPAIRDDFWSLLISESRRRWIIIGEHGAPGTFLYEVFL